MDQLYRKVYSSPLVKTPEQQLEEMKAQRRVVRKARRKKWKRQTIESHKREILARLSIPEGSLRKTKLIESATGNNRIWVSLILTVRAPRREQRQNWNRHSQVVARREHVQDISYQVARDKTNTDRIIKALYYLIDEGKLHSSIDPLEWKVQQSLGISLTREIFLVQNLPDVSSQ